MSKEVKNTLKTILTYAVLILMALVMLSDRMDSKGSGME